MTSPTRLNINSMHETIEVFDYNCSHTMCSPLKTMEGLLGLLENEQDPVQNSLYMDMILQAANKLEIIIKELNQAVLEMEASVLPVPVALETTINAILKDFEFRLKSKGITVFVKIDQHADFKCDAQRLTTIITHLISNAIVFSDSKELQSTLYIDATVNDQACTIKFEDNGCGFDPEIQQKIFLPFFRGSEKSTGPGLGLFIVRESLKKIRGTIIPESEPGKGSRFTLIFPHLH